MAKFYCLFEQSGTFKNALRKLGHEAYDFDIRNEYGETDFQTDLFNYYAIDKITDQAKKEEITLLMFFPCTYFSVQQILWTRGVNYAQTKWEMYEKICKSRKNIEQTYLYYEILCYWVEACINKKIPLIIENPYSEQSFLIRYFPIKPAIIDKDRRRLGDKYEKPTMYYFINKKPKDNLVMLHPTLFKTEKIEFKKTKERSEITPNYAENFLISFVL